MKNLKISVSEDFESLLQHEFFINVDFVCLDGATNNVEIVVNKTSVLWRNLFSFSFPLSCVTNCVTNVEDGYIQFVIPFSEIDSNHLSLTFVEVTE